MPRNNAERIPSLQGWRTIGPKHAYFRSKQEANYGRWLEWQRTHALITDWDHEPTTFWFDGLKRGITSYKPDFRVRFPDGREEYHEVKGWMDSASKTKIKRMAKYHPTVVLKVYDSKWYRAATPKLRAIVPGWE